MKFASLSIRPASALTTFLRFRWWALWAFPIAGCHRANSPAATRNTFWKPASSCALADDVRNVVAGVANGTPVFVRDVAQVTDGGEEPSQYVRFSDGKGFYPAVTIAVSKRKGTNAVTVGEDVLRRLEPLRGSVIPSDVEMTITRDYGDTAKEKSNELLWHMLIAVISVSVLVAVVLGLRESLIVFIAIPVTLALTLTVFYLYGYTLNRITLFALIFSIGILVDDAIVVVENIVRHWRMHANQDRPPFEVALEAVDEVGNPTILATLAVVAAILPMAFVGGLMGPYMRPIPIGASAAMLFSLLVAFIVTPWAAVRILKPGKHHEGEREDFVTRLYRRFMGSLLHRPVLRWGFVGGVVILLLASCSLFYFGFVKVKMLPFDNKSEFQVIVDMPNGTTLEETERVTQLLAEETQKQREVVNVQTYAGTASPYNFNGLVRHYYLRRGPNVADIQVNLLPKGARDLQSHEIAKQVRIRIQPIADRYGARIKVAEVPPGPPVLETLVAEIYGPSMDGRIALARQIRGLFKQTKGVVDVDWYVEDDQPKYSLSVDEEKAAINGISEDDIAREMQVASAGYAAGLLHQDAEKEDVPLTVRLDRASRSDLERIQSLKIAGRNGHLVALGELVHVTKVVEDKSIYHKNLMPVTYVTADIAGEIESPVYAVLKLGPEIDKIKIPEGYQIEQHMAALPSDTSRYSMKWDGEWQITYEVFRDLGIAFAAVLILIYGLVVGWFQSFLTPLDHHGGDSVLAGRHHPRAWPSARVLHGDFDDRLHRRSGHRGEELDHPGGFHRTASRRRHAARRSRNRRRRSALPADDADSRGGGGRLVRDSVRSHFPGPGHCAHGGRDRLPAALAHDRPVLFFLFNKHRRTCMNVERYLRMIAGRSC